MKKFKYLNLEEINRDTPDSFFYEYFAEHHPFWNADDGRQLIDIYMDYKINSLGKEGWELVNVITENNKKLFYFKKEIE